MKKIRLSLLFLLITNSILATEGMWIPGMLQQMVAGDMQSLGMKISTDDIYCINTSCIRDAVVHFNGGCTGVIVSSNGLLLTNHHCGYSSIQRHSSLEHNYLEDGFWASEHAAELANGSLYASIIKEIREVTNDVLGGLSVNATESQRNAHIKKITEELCAKAVEGSHYKAYIRPFYYGNQYILFITEVFDDVRLVGAPPSSIGKFGYDTDNWVWPRHTGDFSVFRIYADKDNKPAQFSNDNVPYQPAYYLSVSLKGVEDDDFTLVYGFPGRTDNYINSEAVRQNLEVISPLRIKMREASLSVIDKGMREDPLTKIQYAAKQSRISNAYKKWIGQSRGLKRLHAIEKKDSLERVFQARVSANGAWAEQYSSLLFEISSVQIKSLPYDVGREYFIELLYVGPEILRFAHNFNDVIQMSTDAGKTNEDIAKWVEMKLEDTENFYKNYNPDIDRDIMKKQLPMARADLINYLGYDVARISSNQDLALLVEDWYKNSVFTDKERLVNFLKKYNRKQYKKLSEDPLYLLVERLFEMYEVKVKPELSKMSPALDSLNRVWMQAQMEVIPERTYYPDANGTLRVTFGKVEGYKPFDGGEYDYYTTLEGIMEKEDGNNPEFVVPPRLKELYQKKDYGRYAHSTGEMRVAFIASNHTSGGNSGSPVINAQGQLIGLNFDRTWESTMSDIMFNPKICRNITVDIRYVLFIMDKYAGARNLVDEMELVN